MVGEPADVVTDGRIWPAAPVASQSHKRTAESAMIARMLDRMAWDLRCIVVAHAAACVEGWSVHASCMHHNRPALYQISFLD